MCLGARWELTQQGMPFLIGIYLIQIATVLITAALYKSIQRVIKYFPVPEGQQLSPMRPRSLITRMSLVRSVRKRRLTDSLRDP